jgi:hypothetical protein
MQAMASRNKAQAQVIEEDASLEKDKLEVVVNEGYCYVSK